MPYRTAGLLAISLSLSGCGLLGQKNKPAAESKVSAGGGCLNDSKDLVNRYLDGKIDESEWKSSINCVNESLDFFTDYVRGSTQDSYTQSDLYTLVSRFLITNNPVHPDLVRAVFALKSGLIGGSSTEFTKEEIATVKDALTHLRDITSELIPYLQIRQNPNASPEELLQLVTAFQHAGDEMADFINTLPVGMFSEEALTLLLNELTTSLNLPAVDNLGDLIMMAKWLLFNTRKDAFETQDWAQIFRIGMGAGGILLAYKASVGHDPNDPRANVMERLQNDYRFREFLWQLALDAKPYLNQALQHHGGAIPLPLFDDLIDELPKSLLAKVPANDLKQTLRPLFRRLLRTGNPIGADQQMVDTVYDLAGTIVKDLGMLDRFYEATGLDPNSVPADQMKTALDQYVGSIPNAADQVHFRELAARILSYQPMLDGDTWRILYDSSIGYSKDQNFLVLAMDPVARLLVQTYGSGPDYFVADDFVSFFDDFTNHNQGGILFDLNMVDPTVAQFGPKRLRDMDLFTPVSDGNGQASISELIHYAMIVISAGELTTKMRNEITPACDVGLGVDLMGWTWVPADCFRAQFHQRLDYWIGDYFPRVKAYWDTLTPAEQEQDMVWLEHGSRRNGYSQDDIGKYDFGSFAAILHYAESLFDRFDKDQSEVLSKSEVLSAYPVFKKLLQEKLGNTVKINNDYILKGGFTYIVKYRSMPQFNGIQPIAKLAWWIATYALPTTHYSADRSGIFNIVCQLAGPESTSQQKLTATICAP